MSDKTLRRRELLERLEQWGRTVFGYGILTGFAVVLVGGAAVVLKGTVNVEGVMRIVVGVTMAVFSVSTCMFGVSFAASAGIEVMRFQSGRVRPRIAISGIAGYALPALFNFYLCIVLLWLGIRLVASELWLK